MSTKKYFFYLILYISFWYMLLVIAPIIDPPNPTIEGIWDFSQSELLLGFIIGFQVYLIPLYLVMVPLKNKITFFSPIIVYIYHEIFSLFYYPMHKATSFITDLLFLLPIGFAVFTLCYVVKFVFTWLKIRLEESN